MEEIKCDNCGAVIPVVGSYWQRFCSANCRVDFNRKKKDETLTKTQMKKEEIKEKIMNESEAKPIRYFLLKTIMARWTGAERYFAKALRSDTIQGATMIERLLRTGWKECTEIEYERYR